MRLHVVFFAIVAVIHVIVCLLPQVIQSVGFAIPILCVGVTPVTQICRAPNLVLLHSSLGPLVATTISTLGVLLPPPLPLRTYNQCQQFSTQRSSATAAY